MFTPPSLSAHLQLPFEDAVDAIATTRDPRFSFQWLEIDVCFGIRRRVRGAAHSQQDQIRYARYPFLISLTLSPVYT